MRWNTSRQAEQAAARLRDAPAVELPSVPPDVTAAGESSVLFWVLGHPDPSLPDPVALVNGQSLSLASYWGAYTIPFLCTRNSACAGAQRFTQLGLANVAFTIAVDHLLVEQYGRTHGVTVSEADIDQALQREADGMQRALAQGGEVASSIQQNLAAMHLTDPSQIQTDPGQRAKMRILLLRSKTYERFAQVPRIGDQEPARADFELRLQRQAKVQPEIQAHLLDPHQLIVTPTPPPLPPLPTPPFPPPMLVPPGGLVPIGTPPAAVPVP